MKGTSIVLSTLVALSIALDAELVANFTIDLVKTKQAIVLACTEKVLHLTGKALMNSNQAVMLLGLKRNYTLSEALTRHNRVKTSIILDCSCPECKVVLQTSSDQKYFNKTYQWMVWDLKNEGLDELVGPLMNIGPNAQITFVNSTPNGDLSLFDVHSKGRSLNAPLEVVYYGNWNGGSLTIHKDIFKLQGVLHRDNFNKLKLRGASVIDRDNITNDEQIISILSNPKKEKGVTTFVKYHYDLLLYLQERYNFTLSYRNVRGWAGRIRGGPFRLGFLGAMMRNEVDIGTSGAFNRMNRFAFFDTIHQSWKFQAVLLYRYTSDIDSGTKSGNFLAPFSMEVWACSCVLTGMMVIVWIFGAWFLNKKFDEEKQEGFLLQTLAALCQQGMEQVPRGLPSRTIVFTLFVFSFIMFNFYTSSVVGGLLDGSDQGPKTIQEVVNSPLKLSFEDFGYFKVLFKNTTRPVIQRMYNTKVRPARGPKDLPVYTSLENAIPFLKKGGYAYNSEGDSAFTEVAKNFEADEICDLRIVTGLLESELLNWIVPKNSAYTELFRIMLCRFRETGIVSRTIATHRPKKPECQASYTVYPVASSGVLSAFIILGGGMLTGLIALALEILQNRKKQH